MRLSENPAISPEQRLPEQFFAPSSTVDTNANKIPTRYRVIASKVMCQLPRHLSPSSSRFAFVFASPPDREPSRQIYLKANEPRLATKGWRTIRWNSETAVVEFSLVHIRTHADTYIRSVHHLLFDPSCHFSSQKKTIDHTKLQNDRKYKQHKHQHSPSKLLVLRTTGHESREPMNTLVKPLRTL